MRPYLTLHDPAQARHYYQQGWWRQETFYDLLRSHAASNGQSAALRDGRRTLSWTQLLRWVDGVAAALHDQGLARGDRVSLWLSNRAEAVVTFLACSRQGYACNPSLHRTYRCAEVVQLLRHIDSAALVTEPGWGADAESADMNAALADAPSVRATFTPETFPVAGDCPATPANDNPDRVAYLAFTSGTTGAPKCVMHSDNTLLANARDLVNDWNVGPEARLLTLSPLSHHIAWVAVAQWLVSGCQLITDDAADNMSRLDWIIETNATYVMGVPTHAMDILAEQKRQGIGQMGAVEMFYMAGSPIPPTVAQAFADQRIKPQNVYGMTENSSHQYTRPTDDQEIFVTTCGRGGGAYQIRIFDPEDDQRPLPAGETGQIGGRGAALMLGYFGNQEATESSFNRGGWFLSGDLGSLDDHGNLTVQGRLKDLIIRGGRNIYPARIEALALRHDQVDKAAAFPVVDERLGEKVAIAVIGTVKPEPLLLHLADQGLSKYDMPEYFVRLDAFPLTASGKILKRELVAMARRAEFEPLPVS